MKQSIAAILTIALLLSISACGTSEKELIWDKTVGAIFVNDTEVLPEHEKLYASFENNTYFFDLDGRNEGAYKASRENDDSDGKEIPEGVRGSKAG